jgi:hypothetical protein
MIWYGIDQTVTYSSEVASNLGELLIFEMDLIESRTILLRLFHES